jgi:hypothetical protein
LQGLAWLVAAASCALGTARADELRVQVSGGACPDAGLVEQKLAPLLPDRTLVIGEAAEGATSASLPGSARAAVHDRGPRYLIEVAGRSRQVDDPARDCTERARVAAVFIALNVDPHAAAAEPLPDEPEPDESEPDEPEAADRDTSDAYDEEPTGLRFGVRMHGAAAYAPDLDRATVGGSAGGWVGSGALRFALTVGVLSPARVPLSAEPSAVSLVRVPIVTSAEYSLRLGPIRAGPALGLVLDVLR